MPMNGQFIFRAGAILMAVAVGCGAFGAHGLRGIVTPERLLVWEKAVLYQLIQGLALTSIGLWGASQASVLNRAILQAAALLLVGTIIFSGTLYLLVFSDTAWLGAITPIGGTLIILGWARAAVAKI